MNLPARIGNVYEWSRTFTQADFDAFAALSGDRNPIHVDPEFSAQTRFGRTVAHGMFLYSCLRALVEERFPGWRQVSQELMFPAPTYAGEAVRIRVEVLEDLDPPAPAPQRLRLKTRVLRLADQVVTCDGCTLIEAESDPGPCGESEGRYKEGRYEDR